MVAMVSFVPMPSPCCLERIQRGRHQDEPFVLRRAREANWVNHQGRAKAVSLVIEHLSPRWRQTHRGLMRIVIKDVSVRQVPVCLYFLRTQRSVNYGYTLLHGLQSCIKESENTTGKLMSSQGP